MSARAIARRFGRVDRFHFFGRTGAVSDDTEQSALVAQALARHPGDMEAAVRAFRRSLLGWFLRLPWGIGFGTLRACVKIGLGFRRSGVRSAGNGAAMRAAILGVALPDLARRRTAVQAFAEVTHTDRRAVEGALFVAELAAVGAWEPALAVVTEPSLRSALVRAAGLEAAGRATEAAARDLGTSGFVVHTVPFALFCYLRFGDRPLAAIAEAISAGGDTDTIGAIVGAWCGARHGESGLPADLISELQSGPFGRGHLRALARSLAEGTLPPSFSSLHALARNLSRIPIVLAHGFRRLIP